MDKRFDAAICDVLGYSAKRNYFASWSPAKLYDAYNAARNREEGYVEFHLGELSFDSICDTIYSEMSYNPVRFGKQSPFKNNGVNDINFFISKYSLSSDSTMRRIANELYVFLNMVHNNYQMFYITKKFKGDHIVISLEDGHSNSGYKMLSALAECIHIVANQNKEDFKNSQRHRQLIAHIAKKRHQNLVRPNHYINLLELDKNIAQEHGLTCEINNATQQIQSTQMYIDNMCEFENPSPDVETKSATLHQQEAYLDYLEQNLAQIRKQRANILSEYSNSNER